MIAKLCEGVIQRECHLVYTLQTSIPFMPRQSLKQKSPEKSKRSVPQLKLKPLPPRAKSESISVKELQPPRNPRPLPLKAGKSVKQHQHPSPQPMSKPNPVWSRLRKTLAKKSSKS